MTKSARLINESITKVFVSQQQLNQAKCWGETDGGGEWKGELENKKKEVKEMQEVEEDGVSEENEDKGE